MKTQREILDEMAATEMDQGTYDRVSLIEVSEKAAWQNAAESLPAQTEHSGECAKSADGLHDFGDTSSKCLNCGKDCGFGFEPVAPVEAKEKERCEFCQLFAPLHSSTCSHWDTEPKPTPSTTPESHQMWCNISLSAWPLICTCVKPQPDSSSIPDLKPWLDQAVDLLNLYHSGYCPKDVAKNFLDKCRLNFGNVAEYKRFVDSSSISTEQTFEEWLSHWERDTEGFTEYEITLCESSARAAWNAAKGQSNGR